MKELGGAARLGLGALQRWFFERVTSETARPLGGGARQVVSGGLPAEARLEIYRRGYFERLSECVADDFPAVAWALGPTAFGDLCRSFVSVHPPRSASLNDYGAPFSEFCRDRGLAFVAELARLEWAIVEAIHADATSMLAPGPLAALDERRWARVRLQPSPALRIIRSAHPLYEPYRAFIDGEPAALPQPAASALAVCRRGDDVWRLRLTRPQAALLERLAAGERLGEALEAWSGAGATGERLDAAALGGAIGEWVACGCFAGLSLD